MSIAENISEIRKNIAGASHSRAVLLVAATKTNPAERVREAVAAGVDACGENRVQEFLEKKAQGAYTGAPVHFIGRLQSNKVNKIVGEVDLIQSVDSAELLGRINRRAEQLGIVQDVLIEVNIAHEPQKGGVAPEELDGVLRSCSDMRGVRVRGLMCIPPVCAEKGGNNDNFARMKQLYVDNGRKKYDNVSMDFLSMGMSADYIEAIECGANMVRVGTGIFGERNYSATPENSNK